MGMYTDSTFWAKYVIQLIVVAASSKSKFPWLGKSFEEIQIPEVL